MSTKTIISILAFVLAFTLGVTLAPTPKSKWQYEKNCYSQHGHSSKITALLQKDIENSRIRDTRIRQVLSQDLSKDSNDFLTKYAAITKDYVEASGSIPTEDLPINFVRAWQKYMKAWENYSKYLSEKSENAETSIDIKAEQYRNEINRTWIKVLKIAKMHRAEIPDEAY